MGINSIPGIVTDLRSSNMEPFHSQPMVLIGEQQYYNKISQLLKFYCTNCHELWPSYIQKCKQCDVDNIKYSRANDMVPDFSSVRPIIKTNFEKLTMIEEMLISPLFAIMSIYRLPCGQLVSKGHVANFSQDISGLCVDLPRLTKSLPILVIKKKNQINDVKDFKVNRERVEMCLKFLIYNNRYYAQYKVALNTEQLNMLPLNDVPVDLQIMEEDQIEKETIDEGPEAAFNCVDSNIELNYDYQSFVEADNDTTLQKQKIFESIKWPDIDQLPINEFDFEGLCSLLFPKLFMLGFGDPTKKIRCKEVTETQGFKHLMKFACLNSAGKYYYPFAQHPRFKFWAYDRIRRHRTLGQCKIYLKNNNNDNNLTIGELKDMVTQTPYESNNLMRRMSVYAANITGSNAFWYQKRQELQAIFEQKKPATVFFTFSFADNHWHDLHDLMPGGLNFTPSEKCQNILNNPHLADWYFGHKLEEFMKSFFDKILTCEWRWYRFEWQSRSSIHAHGAARFSNDPGLIELTALVYKGRLAAKKLELTTNDTVDVELINNQRIGIESENTIIKYVDNLLTATNPRTVFEEVINVPVPHPCSIDFTKVSFDDRDNDYEELINCVQRHVCRLNGYCKSSKVINVGKCRFGYPIALEEKTRIEFIENGKNVRAEIKLKRNDRYLNVHNRLITQNWRANTDMQIILDISAAINYMVKYATKGKHFCF